MKSPLKIYYTVCSCAVRGLGSEIRLIPGHTASKQRCYEEDHMKLPKKTVLQPNVEMHVVGGQLEFGYIIFILGDLYL